MAYINKLFWQGNLTRDAARIEPRHEGDKVFITFCVAQSMPGRTEGTNEERTIFLDCKGRYDLARADKLFAKLKRGAHVYIEGQLDMETKETANGPRTFTSVLVSNIQFLSHPARTDASAPSAPAAASQDGKPESAEQTHKEAFSPTKWD